MLPHPLKKLIESGQITEVRPEAVGGALPPFAPTVATPLKRNVEERERVSTKATCQKGRSQKGRKKEQQ